MDEYQIVFKSMFLKKKQSSPSLKENSDVINVLSMLSWNGERTVDTVLRMLVKKPTNYVLIEVIKAGVSLPLLAYETTLPCSCHTPGILPSYYPGMYWFM